MDGTRTGRHYIEIIKHSNCYIGDTVEVWQNIAYTLADDLALAIRRLESAQKEVHNLVCLLEEKGVELDEIVKRGKGSVCR